MNCQGIGLDGHCFRFFADSELDVDAEVPGNVDNDAFLLVSFKAIGYHFEVVLGGVQYGDVIQAGTIAHDGFRGASSGIDERDFRSRNYSTRLVCDDAADLRISLCK